MSQIAGWMKGFGYTRKKGDRKVTLTIEPFESCAIDVDEWDELDEREIVLTVEERRAPVPKRPMDEYLEKVQAEAEQVEAPLEVAGSTEETDLEDKIELYVTGKLESINHCEGCPYGSCDADCDPAKCTQREQDLRARFRAEYLAQETGEAEVELVCPICGSREGHEVTNDETAANVRCQCGHEWVIGAEGEAEAVGCQRESCDGCEYRYGDVGCTAAVRSEPAGVGGDQPEAEEGQGDEPHED